jgi:hypothetical protein
LWAFLSCFFLWIFWSSFSSLVGFVKPVSIMAEISHCCRSCAGKSSTFEINLYTHCWNWWSQWEFDEVGGDFIDIKLTPIGGTDEVSKDFMVGGQWPYMLLLKVPEHVYDC